jgi:hypothetical protein
MMLRCGAAQHGSMRRVMRASPRLRRRAVAVALLTACTAFALLVATAASTASTTTSNGGASTAVATSTTSTTTAGGGCGGVVRCISSAECAACLSAINASAGFPHAYPDYNRLTALAARTYQVKVLQALTGTASCSTNATAPGVMQPALQELGFSECVTLYGMVAGQCIELQYECFVDPQCRQCLEALLSSGTFNKTEVFESPACVAAAKQPQLHRVALSCVSFPVCTMVKHSCVVGSQECGQCLATLNNGDVAQAAQQCSGSSPSALALSSVVASCVDRNAVACTFWRQRCADNANCAACFAATGMNGDSLGAIAADWSSPPCQRAVRDNDTSTLNYMMQVAIGCPTISLCRQTVANCVKSFGEYCVACLNGSAPLVSNNTDAGTGCAAIFQAFDIDEACQSCHESVYIINRIVVATALIGGASALACLAVAITIVAHGHDRVSMRDRIVIGLMLANAVYSTANAIPLNALHTDILDCGRLAMSFDVIRFGRAWWFAGKYGLVSFELLILGASIHAVLHESSVVSPRAEAALRASCWGVAALAFVMFYMRCAQINESGYNFDTETLVYTNAFNHASPSDDLDDDQPSASAAVDFQRGREEYDGLVGTMLVVWDVLVGVAVALWFALRVMYRRALQVLHTQVNVAQQAEEDDRWADTRRSAWRARRQRFTERRDAFVDVAKPLEPYIAVFVVFALPAIVMSTSFCQDASKASSANSVLNAGAWHCCFAHHH